MCNKYFFVKVGIRRDILSDSSDSNVDDRQSSSDFYSSGDDLTSEDDSTEDDDGTHDDSNDPIYAGAPLTVAESCLAIFTLVARYAVTGVLLSHILSLVEMHCMRPNKCPISLYKFKKFFSSLETPLIKHFYCMLCSDKVNDHFCNRCNQGNEISYFLEIPILDQLKSMFHRSEFRNNLNHRFTRVKKNQNNFEDIYDGSVYKSLPEDFKNNVNNVTFTWNSDGIPLFKSSKISIWPLYLMVNELPYNFRIRKENNIVAGLWFGPHKPAANLFLSAFENDLKSLYTGIEVNIPNNNVINVRGLIISGTCDLPAKALFLNIQQYNGKHGCSNCEIRTKRIDQVQTYPYGENNELRTTQTTRQYAERALEIGEPVVGVKGPTVLNLVVPDYVESTAIDEMHCVSQGITKKLLSFWFDVDHRTHPSSLLPFLNIVDKKIKSLAPPSFINRLPRKVADYAYWKASELKTFLLVYSLPVLQEIMSQKYFEHHILLVYGITLLSQASVSDDMIALARQLLTEYVFRFEYLYGRKYMTCNIHMLLHLPDDVKKFGPLWAISCFPFENLNGILKSYVHGSNNPQLQICSALTAFLYLNEAKDKLMDRDSHICHYCKRIEKSGTHRRKLKK